MKRHIRQKLIHSNMVAVKWSVVLKSFGQSMYWIFEPILFYKMFGDNFTLVLLFYGVQSLLYALTVRLGARCMSLMGIKVNLIVGTFFLFVTGIVTYFMFGSNLVLGVNTSEVIAYVIVFLSVWLLSQIFYWPAFNTDLSLFMDRQSSGKELGLFLFIGEITGIAGPIVGASLLTFSTVKMLMVLELLFILFSIIPLFWVLNEKPRFNMSFKQLIRELRNKKNLFYYLPFYADGVNNYINDIIWGLFLYLTLNSFMNVGWITAVVSLCTGIFVLLIGILIDKRKKIGNELFTGGVFVASVGWLIKGLPGTGMFYMVVDNIQKFGESMLNVPFDKLLYARFQNTKSLADEYVVIREMAYHFAGAGIMFFLALFAGLFEVSHIAFVIASITSLMYLLMDRKK